MEDTTQIKVLNKADTTQIKDLIRRILLKSRIEQGGYYSN